MESLLKNLKQQVTCSICLDTYTEPKTISCLHTFCRKCLEEHARRNHKQGKFRCPECRAEIDLPEGNRFDRLPNSFLHKSLLSLLAVQQSGDAKSITCSQCRKTNPQMYYCFDCRQFMCPDCFNAHEKLKKSFQGHNVTPVRDLKAEDYEASLKRQPAFCSQQYHEEDVARFYCFQCEAFICQICTVTDHQNHKVVLLDKAAQEEKDNIMSGAKMMKKKEGELCGVIKQFEETISELERNVATAKRGVSQAADQTIAEIQVEIRKREREAIESLETTCVSRLERINSAKQEVESLVKQMNQAAEFAEIFVQRSSSTAIMQNKETLNHKFEELRGVEVPKHNQRTFIKFTPTSRVKESKLGFIEVTPRADANRSILEGKDQNFQAGVEAEFTLCPKTSEGEIINQAGLKDQVDFLIEPARDITNKIISEKDDGYLKLKFTPKVPDVYRIEVKINGIPICLFTVQVKERELVVVEELDLKFVQEQKLQQPNGIAVSKEGTIVVTDELRHCIFVFDKDGNCLKQIGSKGHNSGQFQYPGSVTFLNDNEILVADQKNHRIQHINVQTGTFVKSFGKNGKGNGEFKYPIDVCIDDAGHVVVTEHENNRVQVMSIEGKTIFTIGGSGSEKLGHPFSCVPYKSIFLVSDTDNHCIKAFDQSGTFLYKFGGGHFNRPCGMYLDSSNNLLVCDHFNSYVQQFSPDGRFVGKSKALPQGSLRMATAADGRIFVVCSTAKKIYILK